jgi:hypothetical protein
MDTSVVTKLIDLVHSLSLKDRLTEPEKKVYLKGLVFVQRQYELYNKILKEGEVLFDGPTTFNNGDLFSDIQFTVHPQNN